MAAQKPEDRRRSQVPLDLLSSLRGPCGWTKIGANREEDIQRAMSGDSALGIAGNLLVALALYGVQVAGTAVGWQAWGGWLGAGVGLLPALALSTLVFGRDCAVTRPHPAGDLASLLATADLAQ